MNMNSFKKWLAIIGCIVLIAGLALMTAGCGSKNDAPTEPATEAATEAVTEAATDAPAQAEVTELGEGATAFDFSVVDLDGTETKFKIHTDEKTVGAALLKVELVEGEVGEYGLFVTVCNGITADFNTDGSYWAFYENGQYAMTGVDQTEIKDGVAYSFVKTKD